MFALLPLSVASAASSLPAEAPDPLADVLAGDARELHRAVDVPRLVRAATAGRRGAGRRAVAVEVRERAVTSLAASLSEAGDHVRCVDPGPDQAIYRFLDDRGGADYLLVDLTASGRIEDWTWISQGVPASRLLASEALGATPASRPGVTALERSALAGDWTAFEANLDRVGAVVGPDPWLELLRGVAADAQGRPREARARVRAARATDPALVGQLFLP